MRGRSGIAAELGALAAAWRALLGERLYMMAAGGIIATWLMIPTVQLAFLAAIYGTGTPLFRYAVVATAANAVMMNALYFVGEVLDRERVKGTLVPLFLAPCSRLAWLSGFTLVGLFDTALVAGWALLLARLAFGVRLDPNLLTLAVVLPPFVLSMWGLGLLSSALGLLLKKANAVANLLWTVLMPISGVWVPVRELPDALRYPARALPVGYGIQALADAVTQHATLAEVWPDLLPLLGFAVGLPLLGLLAFGWIERLVRQRGELDLF